MTKILGPFTYRLLVVSFSVLILFASANSLPLAAHAQNQVVPGAPNARVGLTKEVGHQLAMLDRLTVFDNLEYTVAGNKVVLSGAVTEPIVKSDAEKAVKSIEGVQAVDNEIQVLPLSPLDDRIRSEEFQAIYSFPNLQKYAWRSVQSIHILVSNGHVTLEGLVENKPDKDTAGVRANSVSGVFSVTNNLHVGNAR